ncbi:diguanylate cyclase [Geobacter sp. DSM 9736]|uniref:diguanylate cyclase n=1 Tax=Geobacter sp. DSM 9736 TaxID=1277350 RepID=UPI000B50AFA8|nr:diguanylate cyclase [Geobacter sp. DSM 9736]SNB47836.1 diguanylate cyclase (GGDEF) domain-containing protein [Geobacter sp. DSM 9736]
MRPMWPKPFLYLNHAKAFLISLCLIISLLVVSLFAIIYTRTNRLILERVREQAISYVDLLAYMRIWNLQYSGVYVEKRPGVESNIYLRKLNIDPDISAGDRTFTVRNHAIMIKELSRISERRDGSRFRAVSLTPLSPENGPDKVERAALLRFEQGEKESWIIERKTGATPVFRYVVPLYADRSCLECHTTQGYNVGSIIGAVSVTVPIGSIIKEQQSNKILFIVGALATTGFLVGLCYFLTWRLVTKLDQVQRHLKEQATTDELTGLKNRRRIMSRLDEEYQRSCRLDEPLCLILIDIDHFKKINDSHGHPFGDVVLKNVAKRMGETLRKYDVIGRIGGEEFLIVAPGTTLDEAVVLAERLRNTISSEPVSDGTTEVTVTVSAGVVIGDVLDGTISTLLKRVDNALYKAKHEGRNRVAVLLGEEKD